MENLTELVQSSVINVRNKIVPQRVANSQSSFEGDLPLKQRLYDYFGLDFKSRTAREFQEINKKVDAIREYLTENFDDLSAGLAAIERQGGALPVDGNLLDHFYRAVKYKSQAFDMLPDAEKQATSASKLQSVEGDIAKLKAELQEGREKLKEAKTLQKMTERIQRLEEKKVLFAQKLERLQKASEDRLSEIQKQREALQSQNGSTPSTTI